MLRAVSTDMGNYYGSSDTEEFVQIAWLCIWVYWKLWTDLSAAAQKICGSRESYSIPKLVISDYGIPWTMQYRDASRWRAWENICSMKNKFLFLKGVKYMNDLGSTHLPQWWMQWQEKPYFCIQFPWTVFSFFIFFTLTVDWTNFSYHGL